MKKSVNITEKIILLANLLAFVQVNLSGCLAYTDAMNHEQQKVSIYQVEWNESVGTCYPDLKYGDGERFHDYDLYLPADTTTDNAKHMVLFIHGGSWMTGDKSAGRYWCKYLTSLGYTTATCDYTLLTENYRPSILSINDEIGDCIEAIKNECEARSLSLSDMALCGYSAGGCQALLRAFKNKNDSALPIKFVINQSGPTTFDPALWNTTHWTVKKMNGMDKGTQGWADWLSILSGTTVTVDMVNNGEDVALWQKCSPVTYINSESVPVVSCYGALDQVVPNGSKYVLFNALNENGITQDYYICPNSGHSLSFDYEIQSQFLETAKSYCSKYFN